MDRLKKLPGKPVGENSVRLIRNTTWRLIAVAFLLLLGYATVPYFATGGATFPPLPKDTFYGACVALAIGFLVPFRLFKIPETLNHEVGHALAASIMGFSVHLIRVEKDVSGVTSYSGKISRFKSLIVSASGPLGSATFFVFTAALIVGNNAPLWMLFTLVATVLITITTVRSVWGWVSACMVVAVLGQSLLTSIQIDSSDIGSVTYGIWTTSTLNLPILISAYCCGISIRYSLACRKPRSETQDEAKFARALGFPPGFGGHLILVLNIVFVFAAMTMVLGWTNPWTPIAFS